MLQTYTRQITAFIILPASKALGPGTLLYGIVPDYSVDRLMGSCLELFPM